MDLKKTAELHRQIANLLTELDAYVKEAEELCNFGAMYDREQVAQLLYNILGLETNDINEFIENTESLLQQFRQRQNEASTGV